MLIYFLQEIFFLIYFYLLFSLQSTFVGLADILVLPSQILLFLFLTLLCSYLSFYSPFHLWIFQLHLFRWECETVYLNFAWKVFY